MRRDISECVAAVRERIQLAARRSGRSAEEITLVAVTKTVELSLIEQAVALGIRDIGENRVPEAVSKKPLIKQGDLRWHLIGHLQSNKARAAIDTFDFIQSVDSSKLAQRLDRTAGEAGKRIKVLIQVDLGLEPTKSGTPEVEVDSLVRCLDDASHLELAGLMTLPPFFEAVEKTRPFFARLRNLMEALNRGLAPERRMKELSMGMSHDFEIAIEEGATMVRVGTAIFGSRPRP
ncbi:MAG TPA: YggS family pyridoxal phosphate-dependent enzyme [Blastocatellia bacterium]|nr:YggS family pyridoxal phosphate-dependent enzyme [Blastocatellia bacterium]